MLLEIREITHSARISAVADSRYQETNPRLFPSDRSDRSQRGEEAMFTYSKARAIHEERQRQLTRPTRVRREASRRSVAAVLVAIVVWLVLSGATSPAGQVGSDGPIGNHPVVDSPPVGNPTVPSEPLPRGPVRPLIVE